MEKGTISFCVGAINCVGEQPELKEPTPISGFRIEQIYGTTIAIPEDSRLYVWDEVEKEWI